jgi:hypothetical protein
MPLSLSIVDNYAFDLRSERLQDIRYQIMGERSLRLHALNEQPNSRPNALIYKYHMLMRRFASLVTGERRPQCAMSSKRCG